MKTNVAFDDSFSRAGQLPTLPGIALKLLEAVQKDEPNLEEIGNIISKDPPLSAEVLKIINSSFYSLPTKITSVFHAINLLGIHTVKNLALSFSLIKNNRNTDLDGFNYTLFWKDSLIGAVATQLLAENIKANLAEDAFFLGLLHNIGILTMMQCLPKQYNLVIKEMETTGYTYHEAENAILGFNHMAVGEYLVKSWKLPETFYVPIAHHHTPEKLTTERSDIEMLTRILHLSALYIDLFNLPDKSLNLAQIEIFSQSYGFAGKIDIDEIGLKINKYTQDIFPLFEIDIGEENDYTEILEAARKELIDLSTDFMATLLNQRQELELLRRQITKDGMTQLNNYQHFYELLHQEIYRAQRYTLLLSLIIADIDYFKTVNDTFGHLAGDHVIRAVADCLKGSLRESDHVARYGGEEFAIILPETPLDDAILVAERLRKTMQSLRIVYEDKPITITMSFGVTSLSVDEKLSAEEFIKRADSVLYTAKESGRNRVCSYI